MRRKERSKRFRRGYTLIEAVITLGMSAILLLALSALVSSLFKGYRSSRQLQIDYENAQVALGVLTKTLRPETLMDSSGSPLQNSGSGNILYGYNGTTGQCSVFFFNSKKKTLEYGSFNAGQNNRGGCDFPSIQLRPITSSQITDGSFYYTPSSPMDQNNNQDGTVGRVTIRFTVETDATHTADLETTVSLRDYEYIGFKK